MAKKRLQKKKAAAFTKKTETARIETRKTEAVKIETQKVEPLKVETSKTEAAKIETQKVEPLKVETSKTETTKIETQKVEPLKVETSKTEATRIETAQPIPNVDSDIYEVRCSLREDELKWLYCELFRQEEGIMTKFHTLKGEMYHFYSTRPAALMEVDSKRANEKDWYRLEHLLSMTMYVKNFAKSNLDFQEKLSYIRECRVNCLRLLPPFQNMDIETLGRKCSQQGLSLSMDFSMKALFPEDGSLPDSQTFQEVICQLLSLANKGVDILCLNHIPYLYDDPENASRLKAIHTILRMTRIITEIVCPGVLLLGNIPASPEKALYYFGTEKKPECHLLYNKSFPTDLWHTVASKDTALLRKDLEIVASLPKHCVFVNELRNEDAISWDLDYEYLKNLSIEEKPHREYLNEFLSGRFPDSFARGELLETVSGEHRLCGTTASLCGIERFGFEGKEEGVERGIRFDLTLHGLMLSLSGIPSLYSGDELGLLNDYSYKNDPEKAWDSRYLHRGEFDWKLVANRTIDYTVQGRLFPALDKLEAIRGAHSVFQADAKVYTIDSWEPSILALVRENEEEKFIGLYNFGEQDKIAWINEEDGMYTDLISGHEMEGKAVMVPAFGSFWLYKTK